MMNFRSSLLFVIFLSFVPLLSANVEKASKHNIVVEKPVLNFFEGALLGNGGMGVVVTTRPDAVCLHFGHNNVWDIRIAEENKEKIGTFDEIFAKAKEMPKDLPSIYHSQEFSAYLNMTADNYRKPYPRPFPCGTIFLGFDRRKTELLGHELDISNGRCRVKFISEGKMLFLDIITDMDTDDLWMTLCDDNGNRVESCFNRLQVIPDPSTPGDIPRYKGLGDENHTIGFRQRLPYLEPHKYNMEQGHPKDKAFSLSFSTNQNLKKGTRTTTLGIEEDLKELERYIEKNSQPFLAHISLREGKATDVEQVESLGIPLFSEFTSTTARAQKHWEDYWNCSSVTLADDYLEEIWYRNLYFFNCAVKAGVSCPGIFANWSYSNIGTAWHGDYHLNYNTQQPFWVTYSSNHLDKNLAYVDLVYHLLPVSRQWAKEYYNMRGAFFPHSAYPVDMTMHPYPVPDWGWEVFETPWMVQGLWWHYLYSGDLSFLKNRGFEPIKDAVLFLSDYMTRPDAHNESWGDNKYHIFPSVPPELYGLQPGFKYNYDTQIDLTLARFIFKAYLEAVDLLGYSKEEKNLMKSVRSILKNMPDYPMYDSPEHGTIYVSVPGEKDKIVYNVPANLTHVFPGEEYGIDTPEPMKSILKNTLKSHQNEGGNDIVFLNLQAARLGMLDLGKFKRQVKYATLPNHTVTDIVLQSGGRYNDRTDYAYMAPMGIWFENFALPAVVNECLMQSYDGKIALFPNWDATDASFSTLRARGGFLVSAELKNKRVELVKIKSEKGGVCYLKNSWGSDSVILLRNGKSEILKPAPIFSFKMQPDEEIEIKLIN